MRYSPLIIQPPFKYKARYGNTFRLTVQGQFSIQCLMNVKELKFFQNGSIAILLKLTSSCNVTNAQSRNAKYT